MSIAFSKTQFSFFSVKSSQYSQKLMPFVFELHQTHTTFFFKTLFNSLSSWTKTVPKLSFIYQQNANYALVPCKLQCCWAALTLRRASTPPSIPANTPAPCRWGCPGHTHRAGSRRGKGPPLTHWPVSLNKKQLEEDTRKSSTFPYIFLFSFSFFFFFQCFYYFPEKNT